MKNIHRIFEKTAKYEPYEFAKGKYSSTYLTTISIRFDYKVLPLLNAEICLNITF